MDSYKAKELEQALIGKQILSYTIDKLINNGKSAAVFEAIDADGDVFAIKIFDDDIVERFGHEIQVKRIEQEISLKNHSIPNLVKLIDGGQTKIESQNYYYIIMEFINGQNLKEFISTSEYDNKFILKVTDAIFRVTEELLQKNIVHRDIKPENIMIDEKDNIILMDLGVLKLIGAKSFSDQEEKQFVGTLRYAPPEFLTRTEDDTILGWRSVNLYQIGGVLHDLIMKKQLFKDKIPYSNLVIAIKEDAPQISNLSLPFDTLQITRDLLIKNWKTRLDIVDSKRIKSFVKEDPLIKTTLEKELDDIFTLTSENKATFEEINNIKRSNQAKLLRRNSISDSIEQALNGCLNNLKLKLLFDKIERSSNFLFDIDTQLEEKKVKNILYKIDGGLSKGFPKPLFFLIRIVNDENSLGEISFLAMFLGNLIKSNLQDPKSIFRGIEFEKLPQVRDANQQPTFEVNIKLRKAFDGTVGFDEQFRDNITLEIIKLIKVALKDVNMEVKEMLDNQKELANGNFKPISSGRLTKTLMYFNA